MDIGKASMAIAENLNLKTYKGIAKKLLRDNTQNTSIERQQAEVENYFYSILNHHADCEIAKPSVPEIVNELKPMFDTADATGEWENVRERLLKIYMDGFFSGYIMAVKDTETFLAAFEEETEPRGEEHETEC